MKLKKTCLTAAAIGGILLAGTATTASAEDLRDNHVVRDMRGNPVHSMLSGTCVRTKWETRNNIDPCARRMEQVAEVRYQQPTPARTLETADKTVTFAFDSAKLDNKAERRLDSLAKKLKDSPDVKEVHIVGFTDRIGTNGYNVKLSQERAGSVKDYLAGRGYVNSRVVETRGLGESQSVTSCAAKQQRSTLIDCLRPDRRVEVEVKFMKNNTMRTSYNQQPATVTYR